VVIPVAGLCWAVDVALDDVGRLNELVVIFGRLSALDPDFTDCPPVLVNALVRR
jgi:hypothetical protein